MNFWWLAVPALLIGEAQAGEAVCTVARGGATVEGPCIFTPGKGGDFAIAMQAGLTLPDGAARVQVDVVRPGEARAVAIAADGGRSDWGRLLRDAADPACWAAAALRICARGREPAPGAGGGDPAVRQPPDRMPDGAIRFLGRCHMDSCSWIELKDIHQTGEGSAAVPGRLMSATQRWGRTDHPGADYPATPPAAISWDPPSEAQYFCSRVRPALLGEDGRWIVLPLPEIFGVTEAASNIYMHICHPAEAGGDTVLEAKALGYRNVDAIPDEGYADFSALIRR